MEINFADLPKAIRLRARSVGPTGERWVATLEETVSSLALKWQFVPKEIRKGGSESLILAVALKDDPPAVLKVGLPSVCDCKTESRVLRIANGTAYPRLLEHD